MLIILTASISLGGRGKFVVLFQADQTKFQKTTITTKANMTAKQTRKAAKFKKLNGKRYSQPHPVELLSLLRVQVLRTSSRVRYNILP